MGLEDIMFNEISQKQEGKYHMIVRICGSWKSVFAFFKGFNFVYLEDGEKEKYK